MRISKIRRSVIAPLILGGMLLTWQNFWKALADLPLDSTESAVLVPTSSSGIDPDGCPTTNPGSADSDYSSGIDPLGRP